MDKLKIMGQPLPNMPWEDRPENSKAVMWRYSANPIIPRDLQIQYPESMTIVLQHQYANLVVGSESFSVELSFGGRAQTLVIPYDAITYFADPYAKFGLSFSFYENGDAHSLDEIEPEKKVSGETAQIISFDSFRKKK